MQLTLGMALVEGGGGARSMESCVHGRKGVVGLRMNRSEILRSDKEPDLRKVKFSAPIAVYL